VLREYLWYQNNCGSSFQQNGLPNGPCSLCWFGHFRDWGVTAVKIVGREASFYRKMRSLQLVKAVMAEVKEGGACEKIAQFARSLRATPEYCDKGYMCYFRDR
jgi:putative protease